MDLVPVLWTKPNFKVGDFVRHVCHGSKIFSVRAVKPNRKTFLYSIRETGRTGLVMREGKSFSGVPINLLRRAVAPRDSNWDEESI